MREIVKKKYPTTYVLGSCVGTVRTAEISGQYSIQMHGRDPRSLTVNEQYFPFF